MSRATGQLPLSVFGARADKATTSRRSLTGFYSVVLFVVFIAVVLSTLVVGTSIYRRLNVQQAETDASRLSMSLLANYVRANDAADAVERGEGPEGDALVLVERLRSGSYETRIYLFEGKVVEEYAVAGTPYHPTDATPIVESATFGFALEGGMVTIETDAGTCEVALRSRTGGA